MHRIHELIEILSDDEVAFRSIAARYSGICKICGKSADEFRTPFAKLEYSISSICQSCQDYYFCSDGQCEDAS